MKFDTATLLELIVRIQGGDGSAYAELVRRAGRRLEVLVRRMLARYPNVARWEEAEDVLQNAHRRLWTALREVTPDSTRSFMNFMAQLIGRELVDLARHYRTTHGLQATRESDVPPGVFSRRCAVAPADPDQDFWEACHEAVARLPDDLREVVSLTLYAGLPRSEVADCLGLSERTVRRRLAQAVGRLQAESAPRPRGD